MKIGVLFKSKSFDILPLSNVIRSTTESQVSSIPDQTPNNEGSPYIWLEIQSIGTFDDPENCRALAPKILGALTRLTGVPAEGVHLLLKPVERHHCVMNGACLG